MIKLLLNYPTSINHIYGRNGRFTFLKPEVIEYRKAVKKEIEKLEVEKINVPVSVTIFSHRKDKRRYDLDNLNKSLLDSLVHGGLLKDDSLIYQLHSYKVYNKDIDKNFVEVKINFLD